MYRLWSLFCSKFSPVLPRHLMTLEQEQDAMRVRVEDQEQRLRGLKTELRVIRRDVDELKEDKE